MVDLEKSYYGNGLIDVACMVVWLYGCMEYMDSCTLSALDGVPVSVHGLRR